MFDETEPPTPMIAWIVSEQGTRWLTASRRFVPDIAPQPNRVRISAEKPPRALAIIAGVDRGALLWEIDPQHFSHACQWVAKASVSAPRVVQIAAVARLSPRDQLLLCELGVAVCIADTEDLPRLGPLIQGTFARSAESLD